MLEFFNRWRREAGVRGFGPGIRHENKESWYVKYAPNFGFAFRLGKGRRVRFALHHGLQVVVWRTNRWVVTKQLFGKSKVKNEMFARGAN